MIIFLTSLNISHGLHIEFASSTSSRWYKLSLVEVIVCNSSCREYKNHMMMGGGRIEPRGLSQYSFCCTWHIVVSTEMLHVTSQACVLA